MNPVFGIQKAEVYLDNASTTRVAPEVFEKMLPFLEEGYGNPEALYHKGLEAKSAVEAARVQIAELLECSPSCLYFTSGGTESNNWALKAFLPISGQAKFVSSTVEHKSILATLDWLKTFGASVTLVPVDGTGMLNMVELDKALLERPTLVSIQYANNETGVIQDIATIAEKVHAAGSLLHVDAVQAVGKIAIYPVDLKIDLMSVSAHKMNGPKGIGLLYVSKEIGEIGSLIHGGMQENSHRAGTLPVHQIVGFGEAAELSRCSMKQESARQTELLRWLFHDLYDKTGAIRNGKDGSCLRNILNVTFPDVDGGVLVGVLSERFGICVSTGASCSRGAPSYVLREMGISAKSVASSLRISIGRYTTEKHVRYFSACIQSAIKTTNEK